MSKPKQTKAFIAKLQEDSQLNGNYTFNYQQLTMIAKDLGMSVGSFKDYITELNEG